METTVIVAAISGIEALIQNEPQIAASIQSIFSSNTTLPEALTALATLRAAIVAQTYAGFVPASDLPKS